MSIKRRATGILKITVHEPLANIEMLEFVFKNKPDEAADELLKVEYKKDEIPLFPNTDVTSSVTVYCELTPEQTAKLEKGTVYMDTRITRIDGRVPITDMVMIEDVKDTLFGEV